MIAIVSVEAAWLIFIGLAVFSGFKDGKKALGGKKQNKKAISHFNRSV